MDRSKQKLYIWLCTISTLLLISKTSNVLIDIFLILLSLPLLKKPITLVPLLFIASWSAAFGIFGLGAFYYYFILFIISLVSSNRSDKKYVGTTFTTRLYIYFALWIILTAFTSVSQESSQAIKLSINVMIAFFASNFIFKDHEYCNKCMLWISFTSSLFFFYRSAFSPATYTLEKEMSWGIRTSTWASIMDGVNPNTASPIVAVLTIVLLTECIKRRNLLYLIPSFLNMYTMVFLGSRTSFYALFTVLAYYLFIYVRISKWAKIGALIGALSTVILAMYLIEVMDTHLSVSLFEENGSGRFFTWESLLQNVIPNHWIMGIGVGRANYNALGYEYDADNLYFDLLCQTGVVGLVLFLSLFLLSIRKAYQSSRREKSFNYIFVILLVFLIMGIGESIFDNVFLWGTLLYTNAVSGMLAKKQLNHII